MTAVTLEELKALAASLNEKIASFEASAKPAPYLLVLPEAMIELQPGERWAGMVLDDEGNPSHHLILLPDAPTERMTWQAAKDWAASVGGELPTRREQSLLYANLKAQFDAAWYWSGEQHEDDGACAWGQTFDGGWQGDGLTCYEGRVRAVRRFVG